MLLLGGSLLFAFPEGGLKQHAEGTTNHPRKGSLTLEEEKAELAELDAQISNADGLIDLLKRAPIDGSLREKAIQSVCTMKEGFNTFREKCV